MPINQIHTQFHLLEDNTGHKLTDVIELHFIELKKLNDFESLKDKNDPSINWIKFINADTEGEMEILAKKDENINKAYKVLKKASMDEQKRMAYEARQLALMDERTRLEEAFEERAEKKNFENAEKMFEEGIDIKLISKITSIPIDILQKKFIK